MVYSVEMNRSGDTMTQKGKGKTSRPTLGMVPVRPSLTFSNSRRHMAQLPSPVIFNTFGVDAPLTALEPSASVTFLSESQCETWLPCNGDVADQNRQAAKRRNVSFI